MEFLCSLERSHYTEGKYRGVSLINFETDEKELSADVLVLLSVWRTVHFCYSGETVRLSSKFIKARTFKWCVLLSLHFSAVSEDEWSQWERERDQQNSENSSFIHSPPGKMMLHQRISSMYVAFIISNV